jgi:hypothetical protein
MSALAGLLQLRLDRAQPVPAHRQIGVRIRDAILAGTLRAEAAAEQVQRLLAAWEAR